MENKANFMEKHKQRLTDSKAIHDEVLLGVMKADLPQYDRIGKKNKSDKFADFIISSHLFQEKLAKSPEFSDILRDVKKAVKINKLKLESKSNYKKILFKKYDCIIQDKGTDYNSVSDTTLQKISCEFYRRHKDDLKNILGQKGLDVLKRIDQENEALFFGVVVRKSYDTYLIKSRCPKVKEFEFFYNDEFNSRTEEFRSRPFELKEGDKVLLTQNSDGTYRQFDAFIYQDNKYKRFYRMYESADNYDSIKRISQKPRLTTKNNKGGR